MKYAQLVEAYSLLESTGRRLEKTALIADFLRALPGDMGKVVLLLQGRIFPRWDSRKIGVASKLVVKALAKASGYTPAKVEKEWKETGDLGLAAERIFSRKKQETLFTQELSVSRVFSNLSKLPSLEGQGSVDQKIALISQLLTSAHPQEARYIIRTLLEDLRVGVGEGVLRDALVRAFFSEEAGLEDGEIKDRERYNHVVEAVQGAYDIVNDFGKVAQVAGEQGLKGLAKLSLQVGRPLKVMLALKANDAEKALERVGRPAAAEYKLDGFRIQVHKDGSIISLFTRRLEDVTAQFPDVVEAVRKHVRAKSCILDCEAVGFSPSTGKYLPFQSISQRIRRKYNIAEIAEKFPVEMNCFDILYLDGKSLIKRPFSERRKKLEASVRGKERILLPVPQILAEKAEEVEAFFRKSLEAGNEGLMLKKLDAPYKPGARVGHMVKLKETMENLDLVVIGAEWGEGKRGKWLSSYVVACRDEEGNLLEVGRVSTGLKEKPEEGLSFQEMTGLLEPLIISEKGREVKVRPEIVIEVAYEEIQRSPTYASGYALRFPRVVLLRSDERDVDDITSLEYLEELYYGQKK